MALRTRALWLLAGGTVALVFVVATSLVVWNRGRPQRLLQNGIRAAERGDFKTLSANLSALSKYPGRESHVHLLKGLLLLRQGDYRDALVEFGQSPPEGELRQPALLYTGECLYRVGALVPARNCLQSLAGEEPDLPAPHRWLAAIHYDVGAMADAVAELEQLMRLEPNDFSPHQFLAQIYADAEKYPKAIEHYRRALALAPPRHRADELSLELAQAEVRQRNYLDALATLERLGSNGTVLALRAECLLNLGRVPEAIIELDQARAISPRDRRVLMLRARIALYDRKPGAAVSPLRDLLSDDPHDYAARYQLAQAYQQLGRMHESAAELERLEASRKLALRLTALRQEASDHPSDPDVRERLAETCELLGNADLAQMWRQAASGLRQSAPAQ